MPSKDPEDNNGHTDTEEETIALRKKRRVSFAETTAVRFFERDDECETPRNQSSSAEGSALQGTVSEEIRDLFRREGCGGDDHEDGDDDEDMAAKKSFFRPIESPSSGSGFGSATSNDEDNFFGPVSADFIKPGCLSDSEAFEENHDVTMDSTAFSMHFRSLARSESGGDIKNSRDVGDKTPTQTTPTNPGNVMVLTKPRTMIRQSPFSFKTNSGGTDSSDMSLVGESLQRYDYGRLSTELDALLADDKNELGAVSACDQFGGSSSTTRLEGGEEHPTSIHSRGSPNVADTDHMTGKLPLSTELVSSPHASIDEAVGSCKFSEAGRRAQDTSFSHDPLASQNCTDDQNITPFQKKGDPFLGYREFVHGASEQTSKQRTELPGSAPSKLLAEQGETLLTGSISSIEHKKMKIFTNVINSSVKQRDSAQFKKVIGSPHTKEYGKYIQSLPSFGKSASRFQRLETVPLSLSLKDKDRIKSSQLMLSACRLKTPINTNVVAPNNNLDKMRQMNLPVVRLEEQFSTDIKYSEGPRGMGKTPSDEFLPSEQVVNISKDQEAPYNPTASLLVDNFEELLDNEASLCYFHSSGAKEPGNFILTENEGHKNITTMGSDSSLFNAPLNDRNYRKETSSLGGLAVMSQPLEFQMGHLGSLNQPYKLNLDMSSHSRGRIDGTSKSVSQTDNGGILVDQRAGVTTSSFELDWSGYFDGENKLLRDETMLTNLPSCTESSGSLQTYLRIEGSNSYSISNNAVKARSNPFISVEHLSQDQLFQETQVDLCTQPSAQLPCTAADKVLPLETSDVPAPKVDICCEESPKSFKKSNNANSFGVKQKSEELVGVSQNVSHQRGDKLVQKIGCDKRMKLGLDVFYRFNDNAQSLFSRSVDKLDTHVIMKIEDVVSCLQKAKSFQVFSEMWCQRVSEGVSYSHLKKVADIKLLLYRTLYKKVKLRLVHEKINILQGKTQLLHSAMKECQELKSKFCCNLFPGQLNHPCDTDDPNLGPHGCDSDSEQDELERIRTLGESLEDSAKKIEKLTKSFQFSYKMKELNCKETVEYVKAHLKRKAPCLSLQQELQLWKVDSIDSGTGYFTVVLKYDGFFCQRFKLNKRNSRIAILSELNNVKILKTWPNIDACTALEFVLTGETELKYTGPRIFAQETQRMSLLFCNLHDVLEEVKQARIEMMNLVDSKFSSPSAMKLDLGLTFMDYGVSRKVMLKLDLSCLNCGIYPSEIMPYDIVEVRGRVYEKRKAVSPPTVADIKSAVGCLGCGYQRILRLCRCVSNMLSK